MGLSALRTNYPTRQLGNSVDYERTKKLAFHDHDIVIIDLNDPALTWVDREELKRIANKKFGQKPRPVLCARRG
ncbi:hypothetical protein [Bradyrhizobium sp. RT10b]|uniref:hypothetical protein n=1 Tax=Bradyrhizobium sp. RT10b TaxID=3156331 RepID=UPI00339A4640